MTVTVEIVTQALSAIVDANTGKDLVSGKSARNIRVEAEPGGAAVAVDVELGYPAKSQIDPIRRQVIAAVRAISGVSNVSANVFQKIVAHSVQRGVKTMPNVKNIIAIASGKGGVGKSTTAVNLALALSAEGASVGMLDADIYGPSQPTMLGISGRPESRDGKTLEPMEGHGIQASSIGFLIDMDTPMVWRGPMVTQALEQLLRETNWRELDYLIVDMPPGTGDIHLTLSQKIPVTGAVIVTTPQDIALLDARKGLKMFEKVGILDADIYGPSQPMMMGIEGRPESGDGKTMEPLSNYGVQVISIGFLIEPDNPMIWRGPMATQALEQLLRQTNWADLDYLIVDMPPGTGDIQLTLSQRVPLTGAVIVTTPQDIALLDAKKGIKMFEKVGVPILGIVENMAVHVCEKCGHVEHIFGADGGKRMAAEYGMDYLGALPLNISIRVQADSGRPTVVSDPDGEIAGLYKSVARQVAVKIAQRAKDFSAKFPTISVSKST